MIAGKREYLTVLIFFWFLFISMIGNVAALNRFYYGSELSWFFAVWLLDLALIVFLAWICFTMTINLITGKF